MTEKTRILHVDDEPEFTDLVQTFLEQKEEGFTVVTASSGAEGLDRIHSNEIHCIVSDFGMPGMNGLEFLNSVRSDHPRLPFILFTGKGSESIASDAISAGVTDYLQKSSGLETYTLLANRIRNAVEHYRNTKALRETQNRFRILVEESTDAIFIVGPDGTITYVTPVAEQLIGYPPKELVGTNGFDHIHPEDVEDVQHRFAKLLEQPEKRISVRFRYRHADGSDIPVEARGRNLLDHPLVEGVVVYVRQNPTPSWGQKEPDQGDVNSTLDRSQPDLSTHCD